MMLNRLRNVGLRAGALIVVACSLALTHAPEAPVADAAQGGDLEYVRALLRDGADVNAAQGDGMTALHWAALNGDAEMVGVLLYAGSNLESTTRLGSYTPLHLASREGHSAVVVSLLDGGAAATARTGTGATSLHFAAAAGDVRAIGALIASGAEIDALESGNGQTPLMFAAAYGRSEAVDALVEAGAVLRIASRVIDFEERSQSDGEARGRRREVMAAIRKAELQARGEWVDEDEPQVTRTDTPSGQEPTRREAADRADRDQSASTATQGAGATPGQERTERPPAEGEAAAETQSEAAAEEDSAAEAAGEEPPAETEDEEPAADEADDETPAKEAAPAAPAPRPLSYAQLVGKQGGLTALHYAVREGHFDIVKSLLASGADIDGGTEGDQSSPLVLALINGHYDMATYLLELGADPNRASEDGVAPLYATVANRWAPKALYPQPTAFRQQQRSYLDVMQDLLERGADPNARVSTHIWYSAFNFDLLGVNFSGATAFWRAAKALDIPAMQLLVAHGADPHIPSMKAPERSFRRSSDEDEDEDPSGLPPVEVGGPAIPPLVAAAGYGYGRSRTGNQHRHVPDGWLATAKYLIEELGADPLARDHDGYGALHFAAARGDNELIEYLVSQGADPLIVARNGQTTVDMANGPIQRVQPFFETIALLEGMGAKNNDNCQSC